MGFIVSRNRPLAAARSSSVISMDAARLPSLSQASRRLATSNLGMSSLSRLASFSSLGSCFSSVPMSARMSSVMMVSASPAGSTSRRAAHLTHDVGILKVAHDLADGVGLADVCQELVAQALTLVSALHQTCDVDELDRCRHNATRVNDVGKLLQAAIGYVDDTHVGVDRGKRVVGGKAGLFGKRGEQRRLAHVGQAHDTDGKGHDSSFWYRYFKPYKYSAAAASGRIRTPRRRK